MTGFVYNGQSSLDYGLACNSPFVLDGPTPKIEEFTIAGKNGVQRLWDGSYENRVGTQKCFLLSDRVYDHYDALNNWLMPDADYHRLMIADDPCHYLMAALDDGADAAARCGVLMPFRLRWDCQPQRFLLSGDDPITLTASGSTLTNPTKFPSSPLIKVYGTGEGTLLVGKVEVKLLELAEYVYIDCEDEDAYKPGEDKNATIYTPDAVFPRLNTGESKIGWTGGVTKVEIIPRWWEL